MSRTAESHVAGFSYGATQGDWAHFELILGLGEDLLPVVSRPLSDGAAISSNSKMKAIGKTPSHYNRSRKVVGIPGWTDVRANGELMEWASEPDYGICVQTRLVRGFDIDVADEVKADRIAKAIETKLGIVLPTRRREGTGKKLLAVKIAGELSKRVMHLDGGAIEFLATGQQFIAVGTHPSGTRYEWVGGLPIDIPEINIEQLESVWSMLEALFGGRSVMAPSGVRQRGPDRAVPDPVADHLEKEGFVLNVDSSGFLSVACPWRDEHSSGEDGDGSTVWMPAGTNGYPVGHFKCLHAHCDGVRSRQDYLAAIGYAPDMSDEFDRVDADGNAITEDAVVRDEPMPKLARDKQGAILPTINNLVAALGSRNMTGAMLGFDAFRDEIMYGPGGVDGWQRFTDVDYVRVRMRLERWGFKPLSRELMRDAVEAVARQSSFDSARLWLQHKVPAWDGVRRVETFLIDYWGADDTLYSRAVGRYIWTALAGRVLESGCKADMVPIFVGAQGCGKSTGVAAMAPTEEVLAEISFGEKEDDLARKIKGKLVVELGELRGLHTRELEAIKAWIVRRHEQWVPKFREFATHYPRRCIFFGTTNQDQFLADSTGNRRWLPVRVGAIRVADIKTAASQLWAEGREIFNAGGVDFGAERLAAAAHDEHTIVDPWIDSIRNWVLSEDEPGGGRPIDRPFLSTKEVAEQALALDLRKFDAKKNLMAIGEILRSQFGFERRKVRIGTDRPWMYLPGPTTHSRVGTE